MKINLVSRTFRLTLVAVILATLAAEAAEVPVTISGFQFNPPSVTIQVGDTVVWTQNDEIQHTSTSDTGLWNSPPLNLNEKFSHTFTAPGVFGYFCVPHPFMTGTVTVQGPPANQPPVVSISSPANGATINGPNVPLEATASDPDGSIAKVQFFQGRTSLGEATSSPFRINVTFAPGTHNITAQATDNTGATASSSVVSFTVTVPNSVPTVSISSPSEDAKFTAPATIALEAQASDSDGTVSKVEFFAGELLLGTVNASPYSLSWTNVAPGNFTLTAKATDNLGATAVSAPVQVQVTGDVTAPRIADAVRLNDGKFQFAIQGKAGQTYFVQISSDLRSWSTVQTLLATEDRTLVTDTPPAGSQFFYRIQLQQ